MGPLQMVPNLKDPLQLEEPKYSKKFQIISGEIH